MKRTVLVSQPRIPEPDRDRGSERVDALIRFLVDDGWSVTFLADEEHPNQRHVRRLRQLGVATFAGSAHAAELIASTGFDLAVIAFWSHADRLLPLFRQLSPSTKVIVDSIDLHFLRNARRQLAIEGTVDAQFGTRMVGELNTYYAADAVLAVSAKEAGFLADFLGPERAHHLALGEGVPRSTVPFEDRRGMLFVGNFRHLPNREAIEYLCHDVLLRMDPRLLAQHPLTVVGSGLDAKLRAVANGLRHVNVVGWVPSIDPYLVNARLAMVPLLHGAGVKGKVVESMMAGTPVVTTPVGAEGLDIVAGEHVMVANDAGDLAAAATSLLGDASAWRRLADAAAEHARANQDLEAVRRCFLGIVEGVMAQPPRMIATVEQAAGETDAFRHERRRLEEYRASTKGLCRTVEALTEPGSVVLVASRGDDDLLGFAGRIGWHFPRDADGAWSGYHPADSESAISHLESLRQRGATYLAFPNSAFWWLHHFEGLAAHLDSTYRRVHADDHSVVYELRPVAHRPPPPVPAPADRQLVVVEGTYDPAHAGPPPSLVMELERSQRFAVTQRWVPAGVPNGSGSGSEADDPDAAQASWILTVDDTAVLPAGFLDDFLMVATDIGAERAQPAHSAGPQGGPPITERLLGCVAREVPGWLPLPVAARRLSAVPDGPVALVDAVTIGLSRPTTVAALDPPTSVLDVFCGVEGTPQRGVRRSPLLNGATPRISVLLATYDRPELLAGALEGFCAQTVDPSQFEVIVVDDGSPGPDTTEVLDRFAPLLPMTWVRLEHAGRAAAKNLAVLLARGEVVVFFDDDDRPAADLLAQHIEAHDSAGDEGLAVLGYTGWAPELEVTPLMHFLTDVDKVLFAYGNLTDGQYLDWKGFWEGRISCHRSFLMKHGLHDQRLEYSIDVEMAWRLAPHGLKVLYRSLARSWMARPIDFDQFCTRIEAKGKAQALIAWLHSDDEIRSYAKVDGAVERWATARDELPAAVARVRELEAVSGDPSSVQELHRLYRQVFAAFYAKGVAEAAAAVAVGRRTEPEAVTSAPVTRTAPVVSTTAAASGEAPVRVASGPERPGGEEPLLTVTIPVWSRTEALADMAQRTIERIWDASRLPTEVIVIDNGSPHQRPLAADVYRYESNRGVSVAWNAGIRLARAPVIAVLNSDCLVEPGWDEALYEAACDGRRIAFPYTDHADGLGFRSPDQAGTAGWCFMLTAGLYGEIGPFDEQFSPAYCEDTDYWHRAWQLDIELSPVPAARVTHARRTTGRTDPHVDWLLQAHRYKYGWKHGVDPMAAPPYYHRKIVEYTGTATAGTGTGTGTGISSGDAGLLAEPAQHRV